MLKINIITIGKLKESYWREAAAEYIKRLTPYARVEIVELKEESFDEKSSQEAIKKLEGEKILATLKKIPPAYVIALDATGKQFSSEALSLKISQITMQYGSRVVFIIGGPLGLSEDVRKKAELVLSLGAITITHQMARVTLLEQLYRAMMIQNNRSYHY
ncbi:MAG: 23S rRNA (pseudouridine(1915)-N(3))-methyltransferase RlmH [Candidatus Magasanikbacteria bacterium]|nr:23S rRNA (pseudouridine(1915)-N(3))-methyltransferase RlmH [Candidatus Magasanikbacteria bacterium]